MNEFEDDLKKLSLSMSKASGNLNHAKSTLLNVKNQVELLKSEAEEYKDPKKYFEARDEQERAILSKEKKQAMVEDELVLGISCSSKTAAA